jgi:ArsR family transcriptional regulator, arsenate/arsenite/antimonite-responsive transcriptional repressor
MARIHELAGMYGALADATRLRILGVLAEGEVSVGHIHEALRIPQPTVSRHLAQLRRAGLVRTRRDGLWVHYRLAEVPDPSARAALSAAIHAVGHAPATRTDQKRLESRVARIGTKGPLPVVACCAPGCSVIEIVEEPAGRAGAAGPVGIRGKAGE